MKKFNPVTEPMEIDFYSIELDGNGGKQIHISGYTYCSEDYGDGAWRYAEACFCIEPLDEFIEKCAGNPDYAMDLISECKQYIGDKTDDEIVEIINHYFDGHPADNYLHYSEITLDTPIGNYCA